MGLMNKILLVLIIISGFLLIFYANNFSPLAKDGKQPIHSVRILEMHSKSDRKLIGPLSSL